MSTPTPGRMRKPRALDLFCGAGGASMGLHRAGFDVTGVDLAPQPRYPFTFVRADAMAFPLDGFDFIWASPPCQRHSIMSVCRPGLAAEYPDLIDAIRERLTVQGTPFIIENVPGSPLRSPIRLCGTMFGLKLYRHRHFETGMMEPVAAPAHEKHRIRGARAGHWKPGQIVSVCGNCAPIAMAREAMGIDWMNRRELAESIPPAYSEYLGREVLSLTAPLADRGTA